MSSARVARIEAADCIGCTHCIAACPFDAIVGSPQHLHAILPDLCTDCALCFPACPVDCIVLEDDPQHPTRDSAYRIAARDRVRAHQARGLRQMQDKNAHLQSAHQKFQDSDATARQLALDRILADLPPP